jgi:hypothetical protein
MSTNAIVLRMSSGPTGDLVQEPAGTVFTFLENVWHGGCDQRKRNGCTQPERQPHS